MNKTYTNQGKQNRKKKEKKQKMETFNINNGEES